MGQRPSYPPPPRFLRPSRRQRRGGRSRAHHPILAFLWRLSLAFVQLSLLATLIVAAAGTWLYYRYARDLPDPRRISEYRSFETTQIYASDGTTLLFELVDPQGGRRTQVAFDQIPQMLKDATIAVEDA
ncbi:MAG: penicillin-binding protein, partial [Chloroflexia bacterium]|nr:penicillin-binding protein [Chloroflexia bacterium]